MKAQTSNTLKTKTTYYASISILYVLIYLIRYPLSTFTHAVHRFNITSVAEQTSDSNKQKIQQSTFCFDKTLISHHDLISNHQKHSHEKKSEKKTKMLLSNHPRSFYQKTIVPSRITQTKSIKNRRTHEQIESNKIMKISKQTCKTHSEIRNNFVDSICSNQILLMQRQ